MTDCSDYSPWSQTLIKSKDLDSFLRLPNLDSGIHRISLGNSHCDVLFRNRNSSTLLVVFGGAVDRTKGLPPFFSGIGLAEILPVSLLAISDPALTVSETVRIGWYTGAKNEPLDNALAPIIEKFAKSAKAKKAILLGGSAGGFASLLYGPKLALPVEIFAMNPQTNILKYKHRPSVEEWRQLCDLSYEGDPSSTPHSAIPFDLVAHYGSLKSHPDIYYFQNESDDHKADHAEPFTKVCGDNLTLILGNWGKGHVSPPSDVLASYLLPKVLPLPLQKVSSLVPPEKISRLLSFTKSKLKG